MHYTFIARLTRTPPLITKITAYKRALCHIITHIFSQSAYIFGHPYSDSSTRSMNPFICTNQHSPQQSVDTVHTEYLTVAATYHLITQLQPTELQPLPQTPQQSHPPPNLNTDTHMCDSQCTASHTHTSIPHAIYYRRPRASATASIATRTMPHASNTSSDLVLHLTKCSIGRSLTISRICHTGRSRARLDS